MARSNSPIVDAPRPSALRRAARRAGRIIVTLLVIAAAAGAVVAGRDILADRAKAAPTPQAAPVIPVAVETIVLVDHHDISRRFSGQFEAAQETALAFERAGTVVTILIREGDRVAAGATIATLDTRKLNAERDRLIASRTGMVAQAELARRTNARQDELRDRGFATDQTLDDTSLTLARLEASIAEIDAAIAGVDVDLSNSVIVAPFAGVVSTRALDIGAIVAPGTPIATLQQDVPPRFRVGLDPALADALEQGRDAVVTTGGLPLPARLSRLSPSLDPATRSRTAFFDLIVGPSPPDRATGSVELRQRIDGVGAWVPLSALRQGPRGTWTLLTVSGGRVGVEAAEVLHIEAARAFVRGTFADGATFISAGAHRVVPGQMVVPDPGPTARAGEDLAWAR
ncbi:efflux RND transporter periplasmic adaptor subunit [Jannaschia donghaensis]|uniref:Nickel and cobalt resistance protein CnrB n=1 Tax=Jannaschia donghaensis TaxID=420998 RepID=A0A0M6YGB7_9RHOB|nr:efflux RND transporter periplasmic adaptor subunit [Jannaschia donghaensis]CTQ48533.1 Nickel and cobalt resistance protein CnrB [Jannaschia donghaensis]